ncbi:toll/interleukin-1 receptor domain-containing protein [Bradyrhizobium monzae]|uniref:toll/interleukin-1 receptor domain-containing protein n=1 Tax=Bradyrhizobium sp. Oc8 TaxID=2876780 RepID=UPI001F23D81B|nr:toll/interleukin-1 receptor domain-containing protein [Bradyrhizobium sp. Oc8]
MNDINACFVSYRHTKDPDAHVFVKAFVRQLKRQLMWLLPNAPIFFDEEGLKVGDSFNAELAYQLCRSACMVMFFSPLHFDLRHPYCALEYRAMLRLEKQRLGAAVVDLRNKGLIFPVVFRGVECLPSEIVSTRHYENFNHVVCESDFKKRDCQARIKELANQIYLRYVALNNAGVFANMNCRQFSFEDEVEISAWLTQVSQIRSFDMPLRGTP